MAKKGGGSQLSQLKSRLHNDGITDRRQMKASAKKRKRGQAGAEKDEMAERREKLSKIASSSTFNPFEEKVTKPKNAVLGRKIRGATGRPGVAKMGGLKERSERLLPEWQTRNKSGSFVDRRFGENGSNLTVEEKMLERFTKERQNRVGKTSLYNLDDAEEEGLTHYGKSLNDLDDYDDIHLSEEEEGLQEEGAHFGGFEEDAQKAEESGEEGEERRKSKAEVMKEVMAKSKLAKYERQQTRAADDEMRNELDNELGDIRSLLFEQPKPEPAVAEQSNEKRPLIGGNGSRKDAYDSAVREMAFERRAKPQDRLKTEAEKAEELAKKLKKAEADRVKRMRGEEVSDEEGSKRDKRRGGGGGDDLEDDFELDGMTSRDVYGLGQGLSSGNPAEEEDEDDDEDEEGDESEEEDEDDEDEDADDFADLADMEALDQHGEDEEVEEKDDAEDEEEALTATISKRKTTQKSLPAKVLPFTFPCPTTHDDLMEILETNNVSTSQVPIVLKRIRALYHPSLAEDNKFKLQAFLGVLLDHIVYSTTQLNKTNKSSTMQLIDAILPQIFSLSKIYPITSAEHFVNKLALMQRNLTRGLNKGPLLADSKTWPGVTECIVLHLTSTIWSTSDRSHAVATPLTILVSQYLSNCRVRNLGDLIKGLFLCCLSYNIERQSKRLVPEAFNFLHNLISLIAPVKSMKSLRQINQAYGIPWPDVSLDESKPLQLSKVSVAPKDKIEFMDVLATTEGEEEQDEEEEKRATILYTAFNLISDFAQLYTGSSAFTELFSPFYALLSNLSALNPKLEERRTSLVQELSRLITNAKSERRALRLQAHRAIAIASHVPKFDQGFNPERRGGRTFDPDTERAEQAKLRSLLKKERKGAIRELRRDNEFLANEKRKEREEEDQRYKKTIDKIVGSLSTERGEQKKYAKEKERLKKRSGKK